MGERNYSLYSNRYSSYSFRYCSGLESVTIGKGVELIEYGAFNWCNSLTDVYYEGSEEEWQNIVIEDYNASLLNATVHFNS